ncbi:LacI family DNA-binding transcriptional regulator [Caloramator australicus]|uniref:Transcriptional regulator YcjW, LacI family,possibly involved in maltodextrin utilization pathway n=1 Tax=Caloramator australicus RC3 TaxID=857293 RepID=I7LGC9_9CLOT|nr:LacI family DNA-binding transcriptional regulator [Caloramator australicus]CCJ33200.1 Transcriptional regulator YcjW, LacI family,possibly involved in maltodextrin utilization pathway [Caloramator australicus RC3]
MPATIKDVAKLANVSISTVSRVINNAPNVNPNTRKRVLDAINKLNFKPNKIAQSLTATAFPAIGIVSLTRFSNEAFLPLILQSIGEVADKKDYEIVLNTSKDENQEIKKCISMIESKVIQGIIILSSKVNDPLIEKLYEMKFPFVLLGRYTNERIANEIYSVDTDNFADSKEAVEYLFKLGHNRIAFIHGPLKYVVSQDRLSGYIEAHKEAAIPVDYSIIKDGGSSIKEAYLAAKEILKNPNPPTAVFVSDDSKAVGVYRACQELNLKIPDDISVIGHNNYEISQILSPQLTTIDVPIKDLGIIGTRKLFDLIEGIPTEKRTILDTKFIKRKSCKSLI